VKHRTVLITGATGGIGGALALLYAEPGRTLVLHGRDEAKLAALARRCEERGAEVHAKVLDFRDGEALRGWLADVGECLAVDLAILSAGVTNAIGQGEDWEDIRNLLDINLTAVLAAVAALLPAMRQRRSGQIALVSSLAAYHGMPITPAYGASKAALKNYGEALRGWLAPQGIGVNVVLPGFVKSAMSDRFPGPKPFMMSAEQAARIIRRGLDRNRARIAFPWLLDLGMRCLVLLPPALSDWLLRRLNYGG
jgi:short-subunit dehydrogenase